MSDFELPPPIDNNYARPSIVLEQSTEPPSMAGAIVSRGLRQPIKVETFVNGERTLGRVSPPEKLLAPTISAEPAVAPVVASAVIAGVPHPEPTTAPIPQTPSAVSAPRVKVVLRGSSKESKVGRMTIFCSAVAVSESLVVIKYPADGQTTIVEPPTCVTSDPLLVDYQGKTYKCISDNWAVELDGAYLVILIRLPDAE
jgi:hypothetical protein